MTANFGFIALYLWLQIESGVCRVREELRYLEIPSLMFRLVGENGMKWVNMRIEWNEILSLMLFGNPKFYVPFSPTKHNKWLKLFETIDIGRKFWNTNWVQNCYDGIWEEIRDRRW